MKYMVDFCTGDEDCEEAAMEKAREGGEERVGEKREKEGRGERGRGV